MRLRNLTHANVYIAAEPAPKPGPDPVSIYEWVIIETPIFPGEQVLCVMDPIYLKDARAAHPGLVTYLLSEIDLLGPIRDDHDRLRSIHMVKKKVGGWVRRVTTKA